MFNTADEDSVFREIDTNNDNLISPLEFNSALSDYGFTDSEIDALFIKLDLNSDGVISKAEFKRGYKMHLQEHPRLCAGSQQRLTIAIFMKKSCGLSRRFIKACDKEGLKYRLVDIESPDGKREYHQATGHKTVAVLPVLDVYGRIMMSLGDILTYRKDPGEEYYTAMPSGMVLIAEWKNGNPDPPKTATLPMSLDESAETIAERFCNDFRLEKSKTMPVYVKFISEQQQAWQEIIEQKQAEKAEFEAKYAGVKVVAIKIAGPLFPGSKNQAKLKEVKALMAAAHLDSYENNLRENLAEGETGLVTAVIFDQNGVLFVKPWVQCYRMWEGKPKGSWAGGL